MSTLHIHLTCDSPMLLHPYDDRCHPERHLHMSRCHTCRSPDSTPIGLRRTPQRITPVIPDGADHRRTNSMFSCLIPFARHHSRREQIRCRASDRYIFSPISPFYYSDPMYRTTGTLAKVCTFPNTLIRSYSSGSLSVCSSPRSRDPRSYIFEQGLTT
jgi:hypothetical protein